MQNASKYIEKVEWGCDKIIFYVACALKTGLMLDHAKLTGYRVHSDNASTIGTENFEQFCTRLAKNMVKYRNTYETVKLISEENNCTELRFAAAKARC